MRPSRECVLALLAAAIWACHTDGRPRFESATGGYSFVELSGWTHERERGADVFVGSAADGAERNTISIRSVPADGWSDPRTADRVVPATEASLRALPEADVRAVSEARINGFAAATFDLTYEPGRGDGVRYARRHVVLVGKHRVFHVLHTAPVGQLDRTAQAFDAVIHSLREEVSDA